MRFVLPRLASVLLASAAVLVSVPHDTAATETYKMPPREVVDLVDAPAPPVVLAAPSRDRVLLLETQLYPSIALLARPFLRLGGVRVDPQRGSRHRSRQYVGMTVVDLPSGTQRPVTLPDGSGFQLPQWSVDGRRVAFGRDTDTGVELWVVDAATGTARAVPGVQLNDVLGSPFTWVPGGSSLLVRAIPADRGPAPARPTVPIGPNVQETSGKRSQMATYQDLLEDDHDADAFAYYARSQIARVDVETGAVTPIGSASLVADVDLSPDGRHLLVTRLQRPFSFRVPYEYFTRSIEVWPMGGTTSIAIVHLPVSDQVPRQGVPTGPRDVAWQPLRAASLVWFEALDGGDPRAEASYRDRMVQLDVAAFEKTPRGTRGPLADQGREVLRLEERARPLRWLARKDTALVTEYDRDRRWNTTWLVDVGAARPVLKKVFDLSAQDSYNDPGTPVRTTLRDGHTVVLQDGDWIYLSGRGATDSGDRPFLDRMNIRSLHKESLFQSERGALERFSMFVAGKERKSILTRRESPTEPPNWYVVELGKGKRKRITDYRDPSPQLSGIEKQLLRYQRADGVPLSGFLYVPPGYQAGTRLPLVIWAYPREYSDAGTAGQVRGSPNTFTRLAGDSPLFFLTQGYAVLLNAAMPVIGDPETMNDTYVEQIVEAARAAIDTLDAMGIIDRHRVCIAGHSYGAFMTANLLAHSDLFAAGIARSGAYNRSLTPFGFQAERRSYWEATQIYTRISPFTYADQIDEPLLLIHGMEDNNSGTFPIQSERLFQAIQGNGGTARLVMLPDESHGYRARESVLDVLAEMFEWCDRYVKNRPPAAEAEQSQR